MHDVNDVQHVLDIFFQDTISYCLHGKPKLVFVGI